MAEHEVQRTDEEWRAMLTPEQYHVTREAGTERPFTGEYDQVWADGTYHCVCCGAELFQSHNKFDHGCGWPSFDAPAVAANIDEHVDSSLGMTRTEVTCHECGAHLGHLFPDGPPETTGLRYCINSAALRLEER